MASELVPVEQEDREAAAGLMRAWKMLPDRLADHVLEGDEDSTVFVQAFARHRLAALEAQASRIAELEAGLRTAERDMTCRNDDAHYCPNCDNSSFNARAKIRTLLGDREETQ